MAVSNPLLDIEFLKKLYSYHHREIFARVTALTFEEEPIECIEGRITGGSVNVDGTSSMRRSCSLTMVAHDVNINDYYWGLNNKFKLEVGLKLADSIKNYSYWDDDVYKYVSPYKNYPDIIWFPMGLYLFTNFSVSYTTNSYNISLQGKDKMCLLNGQVNGSFFASITFDNEEYYDMTNGNRTVTKLPIKYIIREAVHEYAGEPFGNIMVNDLDDLGLELLRYVGGAPMYLFIDAATSEVIGAQMAPNADGKMKLKPVDEDTTIMIEDLSEDANAKYKLDTRTQRQGYGNDTYVPTEFYSVDTNPNTGETTIGTQAFTVAKISYGQTCGYRTTDIIYAGDLVGNVGESLTSILDKIVTMLGEFEYFYDLDGHFVFQKKMNFIDHKFNPIVSSEAGSDDLYMEENTYVENQAYTSACSWVFDNNELITALNNTPDILNIKNDFSLWGERKSVSGASLPIHMRYAIGKKPRYYKTYEGITYLTQEEKAAIENQGQTFIDPFRTTFIEGMDNSWWEMDDWARRYLYICDVDNTHDINYYLNLTTEQILNIIHSTTNPSDPRYNLRAMVQTFWTKNISREKVLQIFNDDDSASKLRSYPYVFLFDTKLELVNGRLCEVIAQAVHNPLASHNNGQPPTENTSPINSCFHTYEELLQEQVEHGYEHSYIYMPKFPQNSKSGQMESTLTYLINLEKVIVCDWREIIYQMAKDYRKHNHEDDFYVQVRKNNGKDINGEWRYPKGITTYEPFYIDLEGFWRQLYCPPGLGGGDMKDVIIQNGKLYWAILITNESGDEDYICGAEVTLNDLPRTAIVHAVRKITFDLFLLESYIQEQTENIQSAIMEEIAQYREEVANLNISDAERIQMLQQYYAQLQQEHKIINTNSANYNDMYKVETIDKYLIINDKYDNDKQTLILTFSETTSYGDYSETGWNQAVTSSPETLNFWFDMMDNGSDLANHYSIQTIGDRAKSVNDNSIKAIYFREVPTVIFTNNIQTQERKSGYVYMQLGAFDTQDLFVMSTQGKCAQDVLDENLFKHSYCTEAVSITALPVYHLQPNTRIYIRDNNSKIDGEYIVSRITLPLTYNGTMTISAIKAVEKIY